jgi:hypothetical protein
MFIYVIFKKVATWEQPPPSLRRLGKKVFGGVKWNFMLTKTLLAIVYRQ